MAGGQPRLRQMLQILVFELGSFGLTMCNILAKDDLLRWWTRPNGLGGVWLFDTTAPRKEQSGTNLEQDPPDPPKHLPARGGRGRWVMGGKFLAVVALQGPCSLKRASGCYMGHGGFLARLGTVTVWSRFSLLHPNPPKHLWEAWCEKGVFDFLLVP